ncbi:hypothetical protein ACFVYA_33885 [Amycolatopsis sp. NPDC058278]|uniref:hypothetical protein n=1 Tax=unclassified Amycolatopsis TaxID=2618356 RepID=UPI00255C1D69|nr:hypothetical protein [Amycolatopsis sp. DG1A-15b]WIX90258.1 hypothetical protein QRY02_07425 [Amycolatopsis sp. DG1A-15b]
MTVTLLSTPIPFPREAPIRGGSMASARAAVEVSVAKAAFYAARKQKLLPGRSGFPPRDTIE